MRKGYIIDQPTHNVPVTGYMLTLIGVNIYTKTEVVVSEGVTFAEMGTVVDSLLTNAVGKDADTGDVMVADAQMNAKFNTLREQFEQVESSVEFANTAVRSRLEAPVQ